MKTRVTIENTKQVLQSIEINIPSYYQGEDEGHAYKVISEKKAIQIWPHTDCSISMVDISLAFDMPYNEITEDEYQAILIKTSKLLSI